MTVIGRRRKLIESGGSLVLGVEKRGGSTDRNGGSRKGHRDGGFISEYVLSVSSTVEYEPT